MTLPRAFNDPTLARAAQKSGKPQKAFGFYCYYGTAFIFQTFAAEYAAKRFLDILIDSDDFSWAKDDTIITDRGIKIRCEQGADGFEKVIDYKLNDEEAAYRFSPYAETQYRSFAMCNGVSAEGRASAPADDDTPADEEGGVPAHKRARDTRKERVREKAPKEERAPRPSKEGLVTAQELAKRMEIDDKLVRLALRKSGRAKPAVGWAWPEAELEAVYKDVVANLKKDVKYTSIFPAKKGKSK